MEISVINDGNNSNNKNKFNQLLTYMNVLIATHVFELFQQ